MTRHNARTHWVSRVIESDLPVAIDHPLLASVAKFGTPFNVALLALYVVRGDQIPPGTLGALFFGTVWLNIGPYLIWYYDERVLPTFFEKASERVSDAEHMAAISTKYDALFSEKFWIPAVAWTVLITPTYFLVAPRLTGLGLYEVGGPLYWLFFVGVLWVGLFTGIGTMGVVTSMLAIREISTEHLEIDPLHPDNLGGLSFVGYYAIRTTLTFSTGSLFLPGAFQIIGLTRYGRLVYLLVALYMGLIAFSFLYPTLKINRRASEIRESILTRLGEEYREAKRELSAVQDGAVTADTDDVLLELETQRLRSEYSDYRNVSLYPMEVSIFIRLLSSIVLPLVFLFLDAYLDRILEFLVN